MHLHRGRALAIGAALLAGYAFVAPEEGAAAAERATFTYQPCADWTFALPSETWVNASERCGIGHAGDDKGFLAEQTGVMALEIDTNGDGKLDEKIKGDRGFAKLRGRDADGNAFTYAVRFKFDQGYKWSASGVMAGTVAGQSLRIVDQNGNGEYDDYGVDAMIVGASKGAAFLSKVVNLGGELYDLEISTNGADVSVTPFEGETAEVDLASKFVSNGELVAAVIKNGDMSFELSDSKNGTKVPVGRYDLVYGYVEKGGETAQIKRGRSIPIKLEAGDEFVLSWGGPLIAEFEYRVTGESITVPATLYFYGAAGEEYGPFKPDAKSPKILVTDKKTGKLVASGRFGGC
jgi:hypothetical protein